VCDPEYGHTKFIPMLFNNLVGDLPKEILLVIFEIKNRQIWITEKKRMHKKLEPLMIKSLSNFSFRGTDVYNLNNYKMMITVEVRQQTRRRSNLRYKYYYVFAREQPRDSMMYIHCPPVYRQ
jgi:hypothetical protein